AALDPDGRLADLLDGGQQQPDQDGDDGDDHQQFDECEGTPASENAQAWHEDTSWNNERGRENGERFREREQRRASPVEAEPRRGSAGQRLRVLLPRSSTALIGLGDSRSRT